jgi:CRISPR-associated protein Cas5
MDFSFLLEKPDFSSLARLKIQALTPLSMVKSMPGAYFRSQPAPTPIMLFGMLENALGWHIGEVERTALKKKLEKKHKKMAEESTLGFVSLLQWQVRLVEEKLPSVMHFDDLWAQHLRGASFVGGSRNYDASAIPIMDAVRAGTVKMSDTAKASKNPTKLHSFQAGDEVNLSVIRKIFPQYYASPTPREYVVPDGVYLYRLETSNILATMFENAIADPAAPLYLGSNDGWVDVEFIKEADYA